MSDKISAYAAKAGRRFRYSDLYKRWESAKRAGRVNEAKELAAQHTARFIGDPRANLAAYRRANRPVRRNTRRSK